MCMHTTRMKKSLNDEIVRREVRVWCVGCISPPGTLDRYLTAGIVSNIPMYHLEPCRFCTDIAPDRKVQTCYVVEH